MPEISIQLDDKTFAEIQRVTKILGTSVQEFVQGAITDKFGYADVAPHIRAEVDRRWAEYLRTGESYTLEEVRQYFERRFAELHIAETTLPKYQP